MPSSVTVPGGSTTATFQVVAPNTPGISFQVTASLGNSAQSISLSVGSSAIASFACSPDPDGVGTLVCSVRLAAPAPPGGATVSLNSSSSRVAVPDSLAVPAGGQSGSFIARVAASDQDEQPQISASINGAVRTTSPMIIGVRPTSLKCSNSQVIRPGEWIGCEVQLNAPNVPQVARLDLSTANPGLKIPSTVTARPGQTRLTFKAYADPQAQSQSSDVIVRFGGTAVKQLVLIARTAGPVLTTPEDVQAAFGEQVSFTVSAADPTGLAVFLSAAGLPDGAHFDSETGKFSWEPAESQTGVYSITFTAANSAAAVSSRPLTIVVDAGKPFITAVQNAASRGRPACSPGSVATLTGRWLAPAESPASNPSGAVELGGARVKVNGEYVPLVFASSRRIDFLCPPAAAGTGLTIVVESRSGSAGPVSASMHQSAPGIYSTDATGIGQGAITLTGTTLLAAGRDYLEQGQPAEPGDSITIRATGIGGLNGAYPPVRIGEFYAQVESVRAAPGAAGVFEITAKVPLGVEEGDAIPVVIGWPNDQQSRNGGALDPRDLRRFVELSNTVTIAVERSRP
ncbi:MAG: putative Ig domain-containing protein [Acidobacteriia bacterium]|nr:putative Ig domain-containing protein [Terriglobia bacterium]